ncbi:alpha/beta hydrolase fold domain-containing protein [Coraliomargarita sp. W4R53]
MINYTIKWAVLLCLYPFIYLSAAAANESTEQWPGTESSFHGFKQHDFQLEGLDCKVVSPKTDAEGKPWIWRTNSFGNESKIDIVFLEQGFHIAYVAVDNLFGSPEAVQHFTTLYQYLTQKHNLNPKPALAATSHGGLIAYNWACANPEKVSCIYADSPVCDFKSWPGGKGKSQGHAEAWAQCLEAYGLTDGEAMAYRKNPLGSLKPLAKARVPLLHVVADADKIVPVAENTTMLEQRYTQLGGSIKVIHKPGSGQSPKSLQDPAPIVNFILKHTGQSVDQELEIPALDKEPLPDAEHVYKTASGVKLKLYQFSPAGLTHTDKRPAIVFFFGGGWSGGTATQFYVQADYLAQRGMVAFTADYRVSSRNKTTPFESVEDAKSAVRWIRQHASELGIDPNRIVAAGGSAGGHIALCTAIIDGYNSDQEDLSISSVPNAVIGFNPVADTSEKTGFQAPLFKRDSATSASPIHHVRPGLPPILIFHGTADRTVPFEQIERFTQLMQENGNSCQLIPFPGKTHGFFNSSFFRSKYTNDDLYQTMHESVQFLTKLNLL